MRRVSHEILSVATVLVVPLVLIAVFPHRAIGFSARKVSCDDGFKAAFVVLTDSGEEAAMRLARSSWQVGSANVRGMFIDPSVGAIPNEPTRPVLARRPYKLQKDTLIVDYAMPTLKPGESAKLMDKDFVDSVPVKPMEAFAREELLKLK